MLIFECKLINLIEVVAMIDENLSIVQVSPYKKGLRNGPKALKPIPVIIRCK